MTEIINEQKSAVEQLNEYVEKKKRFNIFKILKLEDYEIRHSNFLAWLLNPNETHELGDCFLTKFMQSVDNSIKYDNSDDIEVLREQENIDILILNKTKKYLILIENKINSNQHDNQLERYQSTVNTKLSDYDKYFVYLKPENNEELLSDYKYVSYETIKKITEHIILKDIKYEIALILSHYVQILNERYLKLGDTKLLDICLKISNDKKIDELSQDKRELVWQMEQRRRYEIMQIISEILKSIEGINVPTQNNIYKVQFNKSSNNVIYAFDNTCTKNNSEIYFLTYDGMTPNMLFLNEQEYNEIYYQYNDSNGSAYDKMKYILTKKVKNIVSDQPEFFTV